MKYTRTALDGVYVQVISTADLFVLQDMKASDSRTEEQASRDFGVALMRMSAVREDGTPIWESDNDILAMPAPDFMKYYEPICKSALDANGLGEDEPTEGND